jgi:hypothetical protein
MSEQKKPAASPDRKAVEALQSVIKKSNASKPAPKPDADPGPEPLSNIHSVSDAYRIGKDRLSRAFFGPPKAAEK